MRTTINLLDQIGKFGEDKDAARAIRQRQIIPALESGNEVALDFTGVSGATQSFIHALIAEPIMRFRDQAFEILYYISANDEVAEIISIVYRYLQESFEDMER